MQQGQAAAVGSAPTFLPTHVACCAIVSFLQLLSHMLMLLVLLRVHALELVAALSLAIVVVCGLTPLQCAVVSTYFEHANISLTISAARKPASLFAGAMPSTSPSHCENVSPIRSLTPCLYPRYPSIPCFRLSETSSAVFVWCCRMCPVVPPRG